MGAAYGPEVVALEAGDVPVPGAGTQLGWLLWAGALEPAVAALVAERLCRPDVLTDLGDLVVAAYRDAKARVDELASQALGPLAGGGLDLDLGGAGGLPGAPESRPTGGFGV